MIVRAGEGSVRDNQSLLDQAISHGDGKVTAATVKAMLGLGDRARSIDLFEALMRGDIADALTLLRELYDAGADPETVIGDLADFTNLVTRMKIVPAAADDVSLTPDERTRGPELAQKLGMRALSRAWQILFKGIEEVQEGRQWPAGRRDGAGAPRLCERAAEPGRADHAAAERAAAAPPPTGGTVPHRGSIGGGGHRQALRQVETAPRYEASRRASPPRAAPQAMPSPRSYLELVALAARKARHPAARPRSKRRCARSPSARKSIEVALVEGADPAIIQTLSAPAEAMDRPDVGHLGVAQRRDRPDHPRRARTSAQAQATQRGDRRSAGEGHPRDVPGRHGQGDAARGARCPTPPMKMHFSKSVRTSDGRFSRHDEEGRRAAEEDAVACRKRPARRIVEGRSGGGLVTVSLTGKGEMKGLKIDPSLFKEDDVEVLEDLIVTAHNEAKVKAEQTMQQKMAELTAGPAAAARHETAVLVGRMARAASRPHRVMPAKAGISVWRPAAAPAQIPAFVGTTPSGRWTPRRLPDGRRP